MYDGPFSVADTANLAVRQIEADGTAGPVARARGHGTRPEPPRLLDAVAGKPGNTLELTFSEPLAAATAQEVRNYTVQPALALAQAAPSADGRKVMLDLRRAPGTRHRVHAWPARAQRHRPRRQYDPAGAQPFNARNIVYTFNAPQLPAGGVKTSVIGLPAAQDRPLDDERARQGRPTAGRPA